MSSTPTLFNAGTRRSQLSCCYLTTVADDLDGIYEAIKENALLSKFAGGLGNDWTHVRALGSHIKGTNGKIAGRRAVPQGRQRHRGGGQPGRQAQGRGLRLPRDLAPRHRGVPRAAQEHRRRPPPHARHEHRELDSGPVHEARDGRRRLDAVLAVRRARPARQVRPRRSRRPTSPTKRRPRAASSSSSRRCRAPTCGARCCRCCSRPGIRGSRSRTPATCARRSSTSASCTARTCAPRSRSTPATTEIAVCNLGSVNLLAAPEGRRRARSRQAASRPSRTAMRMLDNVIDINYYAVKKARDSNLKHRPVGLGIMGFQDCLHLLRMPYASRGGGRVRRPLDGSRLLLRLLGVDRARRGARPLLELQGLAVGPRHPAAGLAQAAGRGARRLRRGRQLGDARLGRAARAHQAARHAQLQLRRHRADGDDLQHHRRRRLDRARATRTST